MKLQSFQYDTQNGWSVPEFPAMDSENTLIIVFSAPEFYNLDAPLKELIQHYPKAKIIGCSTAGEIFGSRIFDRSMTVAVLQFENTPIKIIKTEIKFADQSYTAGADIAAKLDEKALRGIFVLSDGLNVNGSELVKGLNTAHDKHPDVVITGGLAADGPRLKQTWTIFEGKIITNHVVAVGFYGDHVRISHASRAGWDIFGPERRITRSKNNILYELDAWPALALYKEYLGERSSELPTSALLYPLAIRKNPDDTHQLVRTILGMDEQVQSLTFAGDMPTGYLAQLMRANFDRLITAAAEAGDLAVERMQEKTKSEQPMLNIAISCVGRRLLLGERTEEETEATLESLPADTKQIGFYAYGELSPYETGQCDLHNQTMTLTMITEI